MVDVITVGRVSLDLFSQNEGAPFEEIRGFDASVGGSPSNIAIGSARLGLQSLLISAVGDDLVGRLVIHRLQQEKVNTAFIPVKSAGHTPLAILGVQPPDRFPLTFYRQNPADIHLTIDDVRAAPVAASRAILLSGTALSRGTCADVIRYLAESAREHRVTTMMDLDLRRDQWTHPLAYGLAIRSMAAQLDVIIGTEEEFYAVWGGDAATVIEGHSVSDSQRTELNQTLQHLHATGVAPTVFVVKRGARGVSVLQRDFEAIDVPGFAVEVVNTVGAGDAFASGFIYGFVRGCNWPECARLGNACGAIVVTRNGCSTILPYLDELEKFIATHSQSS